MTRGKGSRIRMGRDEGRHKIEILKGRALCLGNVYQIRQIIDHTERKSRMVIEAPPKIEPYIVMGLFKYIK